MRIRTGHHIECLLIDYNIRTEHIQQCKQIIIACLQWCCCQHYYSICVITEVFNAFIFKCLFLLHAAVTDMMRLIDDNKIKVWSRIQIS